MTHHVECLLQDGSGGGSELTDQLTEGCVADPHLKGFFCLCRSLHYSCKCSEHSTD